MKSVGVCKCFLQEYASSGNEATGSKYFQIKTIKTTTANGSNSITNNIKLKKDFNDKLKSLLYTYTHTHTSLSLSLVINKSIHTVIQLLLPVFTFFFLLLQYFVECIEKNHLFLNIAFVKYIQIVSDMQGIQENGF